MFCFSVKQTLGDGNNGNKLTVISSEKHTWEIYETFN